MVAGSTLFAFRVPLSVNESDETDRELVAAVREGNRAAAGRLAERYLRGARAIALSITRDVDSSEDVCQDAFVYAIAKIDDCRDPDRFGAWLRQIVRSHARNHLRRLDVRRTEPLLDDTASSPGESPAVAAERSDTRERLLAALGSLSDERREVVLLHDLEGWTHAQISARTGVPSGTVRSHLHFARKKLRELLGDLREGASDGI